MGDNSDWANGLRDEILVFRSEVFENAIGSGSAEARKLAGCLVQALFGASFGYKPCCIFNFVKDTYKGVIPQKALSKADERHMCPECREEEE